MQGRVETVSKSQSGKSWRVKIGPKFYGANFDSKIDAALGRQIDFDADDGKFGPWVKTWAYINVGAEAAEPVEAPSQPITREPVLPTKVADRWWANFMSNCVGQAIASKTITEYQQIEAWALAARRAALRADDDIPF